jgi:transposase
LSFVNRQNNNNKTEKETDMKELMAGLDLHSNNIVVGLVDAQGKRVGQAKLACNLQGVLEFLAPFKKRLKRMAVESTYNWYWLVDGLQAAGYPVVLANPAKITQYSGLKHADDQSDAFFLAELLRLDILPTGYVYDVKLRPVRDLLRRRISLVQQRTALMLSFKSLFTRTTGELMTLGRLKGMEVEEARELYEHPANQLIAGLQIHHVEQLKASILELEQAVLKEARELPAYAPLQTLPGVGRILGLTITMEIGDITRFAGPGQFASYCRTVAAQRTSNEKFKGANNRKCGNRYLAWAFVEAANFAKRYDETCRKWYDRKAAKTSTVLATKALACKLAKAAWHVVTDQSSYEPARMFPGKAGAPMKA